MLQGWENICSQQSLQRSVLLLSPIFLFGKDFQFDNDASFVREGLIDSTGVLQLVTYLEEAYGIEIENDELIPENLDTINRIANYLDRKLNAEAALSFSPIEAQALVLVP